MKSEFCSFFMFFVIDGYFDFGIEKYDVDKFSKISILIMFIYNLYFKFNIRYVCNDGKCV